MRTTQVAQQTGAYPRFCSVTRPGAFLLPLEGMIVQRRVVPTLHLPVPHLYTWVERGTVIVKCFAQKHNTMSLTRAHTRTTRSEDESTNREATSTLR